MSTLINRYYAAIPLLQSFADQANAFVRGSLSATGGYSGSLDYRATAANPVVTNPWGITAQGSSRGNSFYLRPGQSINYVTGRLSDPNLHANTAAKLTQSLLQGQANEAGLTQASATSARDSSRVLASLDEQYWGNASTAVTTSTEVTGAALANEQGIAQGRNLTILGGAKKTSVPGKPPAKRALS